MKHLLLIWRANLYLFFVPLLLIFALPLAALSQTGTIEGTVYDGNTNAPIVGADVHILGTDERQTTDTEGKFWFIEIVPGTYTMSITHEMYDTPTETDIEVTAGAHHPNKTVSRRGAYARRGYCLKGNGSRQQLARKDIPRERIDTYPRRR